MNHSMLLATLMAAVSLAACDKPTVVTVPTPVAVPVPGPAGPQGEAGKPGESTTVIVTPPAASAPN